MRKEDEMLQALMGVAREDAPKVQNGLSAFADNVMNKGLMPKDALGISDGDSEHMYAQAYQLYNMGKYRDARNVFATLMILAPTESKYLFGHAASSHMLKEYVPAAKVYVQQALIDTKNPIPYYHAADCYLQLGDQMSALVALKLVVKRSGSLAEYSMIKERAELTIKSLQNKEKAEGLSDAPPDLGKKE